jgi:hypothetical protein
MPGGVGGAVLLEDDILKLIGDGFVDPQNDVDVGGAPLRVGEEGVDFFLDMVMSIVLLEDEEEEFALLFVVAGGDFELEFDIPCDVNVVCGG